MSKQFRAFTCTGRDCEENCGVVLIVRELGASAGADRSSSSASLMLGRTLHRDCGRCLVPTAAEELPA